MKAGPLTIGALLMIVGLVVAIYGDNEYNIYSGWAASLVYPNAAQEYGIVTAIGALLCISGFITTIYGGISETPKPSNVQPRILSIMACPKCYSRISTDNNFCPRCGADLRPQPPAPQFQLT